MQEAGHLFRWLQSLSALLFGRNSELPESEITIPPETCTSSFLSNRSLYLDIGLKPHRLTFGGYQGGGKRSQTMNCKFSSKQRSYGMILVTVQETYPVP